jgi:hypothetical protein
LEIQVNAHALKTEEYIVEIAGALTDDAERLTAVNEFGSPLF